MGFGENLLTAAGFTTDMAVSNVFWVLGFGVGVLATNFMWMWYWYHGGETARPPRKW